MVEQLIIWVPLLPLLAALWIAFGQITNNHYDETREKLTARISVIANLAALVIMLSLVVMALANGAVNTVELAPWFSSGDFSVTISFLLDGLGLAAGTLVAFVSALVIWFSVNYMHRETGFHRFFMVMNLFVAAMLLIVLAGNAVMAFVGWELAGLSSYLLIGYTLDRPTATDNANRVFVTNRIGDSGFLLAIFLAYNWAGSTDWALINQLTTGPGGFGVGLIAISFLIAALVKSAAVPFSPWLSRALEGPTPSSAIFYGVLMVHAGVYLLIRLQPLLIKEPVVMAIIAGLGLLTVLYGWISGLVQSDVKASLIHATTTQVGWMFFWCGIGWFELAAWHMLMHASWRAYQFLHAPSLMAMVGGRAACPAPRWISTNRWFYSVALQRFWLEHIAEAWITRPTRRLALDIQNFDERVVVPLVGLPSRTDAVSSLTTHQDQQSGAVELVEGSIGRGEGLIGKLLERIAMALHWFEEHLVLKGGDQSFMNLISSLGNRLIRVDDLLSQPRYIWLLLFIVLAIIL